MDSNGILQKYVGYGFKEVGRLPVNSTKNLLNAGQATTGQFMNENGLCFTKNGTILAMVTGSSYARFQKWIKLFPEVEGQVVAFQQMAIGTESTPRIQIKCCFTLTGQGEFYKMIVTSNEDIKA